MQKDAKIPPLQCCEPCTRILHFPTCFKDADVHNNKDLDMSKCIWIDQIVPKEYVIHCTLIIAKPIHQSYNMTWMLILKVWYDLDVDIKGMIWPGCWYWRYDMTWMLILKVWYDLDMFLRTRLVGERFSPMGTFSLPISLPWDDNHFNLKMFKLINFPWDLVDYDYKDVLAHKERKVMVVFNVLWWFIKVQIVVSVWRLWWWFFISFDIKR